MAHHAHELVHRLRVHVRNILIVFLLSGFWHGADWHFAAWGLYHGVLLSLGVLWGQIPSGRQTTSGAVYTSQQTTSQQTTSRVICTSEGSGGEHTTPEVVCSRLLHVALTFLLTSLGWVLFRASSMRHAFSMYSALVRGWTDPGLLRAAFITAGAQLSAASLIRLVLIPVLLYLIRTFPAVHSPADKSGRTGLLEITIFLMAASILVSWIGNLAGGTGNDFIYFQF